MKSLFNFWQLIMVKLTGNYLYLMKIDDKEESK